MFKLIVILIRVILGYSDVNIAANVIDVVGMFCCRVVNRWSSLS